MTGKKDIKEDIMSILDGRRKFSLEEKDGAVKNFYIGEPTAEDVRLADWEHAKRYNQALREGIYTVSEMMEILKKRNIIGPDYDKVGDDLRQHLSEKVIEMERENDREERMRLAMEVADLREEVFQWNHRLSSPLASTCENMANDSRVEFLTSCVIQHEDGSRLWPTFEDYRAENNLALQSKARLEVMLWLEGVESDFLDKAPENKVMRELMEVDMQESSVANEEPVSEEEAVEEKTTPETAPKKRASRKKAAAK